MRDMRFIKDTYHGAPRFTIEALGRVARLIIWKRSHRGLSSNLFLDGEVPAMDTLNVRCWRFTLDLPVPLFLHSWLWAKEEDRLQKEAERREEEELERRRKLWKGDDPTYH